MPQVERTGDVSVPVQQQEQSQSEIESAIIEIEVPEQEVVQQAVLRPLLRSAAPKPIKEPGRLHWFYLAD